MTSCKKMKGGYKKKTQGREKKRNQHKKTQMKRKQKGGNKIVTMKPKSFQPPPVLSEGHSGSPNKTAFEKGQNHADLQNALNNPMMGGAASKIPAPMPTSVISQGPMSGSMVALHGNNTNLQGHANSKYDSDILAAFKKQEMQKAGGKRRGKMKGGHHEWILLLGSVLMSGKKNGNKKSKKNKMKKNKNKTLSRKNK